VRQELEAAQWPDQFVSMCASFHRCDSR